MTDSSFDIILGSDTVDSFIQNHFKKLLDFRYEYNKNLLNELSQNQVYEKIVNNFIMNLKYTYCKLYKKYNLSNSIEPLVEGKVIEYIETINTYEELLNFTKLWKTFSADLIKASHKIWMSGFGKGRNLGSFSTRVDYTGVPLDVNAEVLSTIQQENIRHRFFEIFATINNIAFNEIPSSISLGKNIRKNGNLIIFTTLCPLIENDGKENFVYNYEIINGVTIKLHCIRQFYEMTTHDTEDTETRIMKFKDFMTLDHNPEKVGHEKGLLLCGKIDRNTAVFNYDFIISEEDDYIKMRYNI